MALISFETIFTRRIHSDSYVCLYVNKLCPLFFVFKTQRLVPPDSYDWHESQDPIRENHLSPQSVGAAAVKQHLTPATNDYRAVVRSGRRKYCRRLDGHKTCCCGSSSDRVTVFPIFNSKQHYHRPHVWRWTTTTALWRQRTDSECTKQIRKPWAGGLELNESQPFTTQLF